MPPKPRFTREEILAAALRIVSEHGMQGLTAKALGNALHASATPIFTVFHSMQEVAAGVKTAAMERFASYAHKTGADMPAFKQVGMQMILFAREEPWLYQFLFMSPNSDVKSFADMYAHLGGVAEECLQTYHVTFLHPRWKRKVPAPSMTKRALYCFSAAVRRQRKRWSGPPFVWRGRPTTSAERLIPIFPRLYLRTP